MRIIDAIIAADVYRNLAVRGVVAARVAVVGGDSGNHWGNGGPRAFLCSRSVEVTPASSV